MSSILIIDDQRLILNSLKVAMEKNKYTVFTAATGSRGIEIVKTNNIDLVLLDIRLPDMNGIEVLKRLKEIDSDLIVLMMTGYGTIESAVSAMRFGAFDYINKPFKMKTISTIIKLALETQKLKKEVGIMQAISRNDCDNSKIIGNCRAIFEIMKMIDKISQTDSSTVLIQGESGTGKELVAKQIHFNSSRAQKSFVEINCAAIPYQLLESELFGYEQGAFTDAKKGKKGLLEIANGGTLFLDEIGDMDPGMQSKILNVLQEKKFRRLGGDKLVETDMRIIAATNYDLHEQIRSKKFREDLFYRLNVINICLPPLRDRGEDILLLAFHFIKQFNQQFKKTVGDIVPDAADYLKKYSWPGNVRELKNVIERIMILNNSNTIMVEHLPIEIRNSQEFKIEESVISQTAGQEFDLKTVTESLQKKLIQEALDRTSTKAQAAKMLKIDRFSLRYLMNKLKIS